MRGAFCFIPITTLFYTNNHQGGLSATFGQKDVTSMQSVFGNFGVINSTLMRLIIAFGYFISMCHGLNSQSDLAYLPGYFEDIDSSSKLKKAVDKTTVRPATVAQPALPAATVLKASKIDSERLVHWQAAFGSLASGPNVWPSR